MSDPLCGKCREPIVCDPEGAYAVTIVLGVSYHPECAPVVVEEPGKEEG
jgi:hypothetical protein